MDRGVSAEDEGGRLGRERRGMDAVPVQYDGSQDGVSTDLLNYPETACTGVALRWREYVTGVATHPVRVLRPGRPLESPRTAPGRPGRSTILR